MTVGQLLLCYESILCATGVPTARSVHAAGCGLCCAFANRSHLWLHYSLHVFKQAVPGGLCGFCVFLWCNLFYIPSKMSLRFCPEMDRMMLLTTSPLLLIGWRCDLNLESLRCNCPIVQFFDICKGKVRSNTTVCTILSCPRQPTDRSWSI